MTVLDMDQVFSNMRGENVFIRLTRLQSVADQNVRIRELERNICMKYECLIDT